MSPIKAKIPSTLLPRSLKIEHLEKRELLAVLLDGDILRVTGTDGADTASIDPYMQSGEQWITATLNGDSSQYAASSIRKIVFTGNDGDDYFVNSSNLVSHVWGNAGLDTLIGGSGNDRLYGGSWSDSLAGGAGNDRFYGSGGNDTIYGGGGNDSIYGHSGADWLYGEDGDDSVRGSSGNDRIWGGAGHDFLHGHTGFDTINGEDGNDTIYGHAADDTIYAGDGDDRVYGGGQNDTIYGEGGNDYLFGTIGDNWISGGDGNDRVYGGDGQDDLMGNSGNDRIRAYGGNDNLYGGDGNDVLFGSDGDDTIYGGVGDDFLYGDAGDDNLYGEVGADQLFGDAGNDGLFGGGVTADYLTGGADSDRFLTQTGDSILDYGATDAELVFVDGTTQYTLVARNWTDADIQKTDLALFQLHQTAGSALILRDTYTDYPVKMYIAESFTLGANVAGFNWFNGYERQIHIRGNLSNESFGATVVHEFGHNWDSSNEGNQYWTTFNSLNLQSYSSNDYTRSYGQTNAKEDWCTNWELFFGYYTWAAPAYPSAILQQKQAAVQNFFADFVGAQS